MEPGVKPPETSSEGSQKNSLLVQLLQAPSTDPPSLETKIKVEQIQEELCNEEDRGHDLEATHPLLACVEAVYEQDDAASSQDNPPTNRPAHTETGRAENKEGSVERQNMTPDQANAESNYECSGCHICFSDVDFYHKHIKSCRKRINEISIVKKFMDASILYGTNDPNYEDPELRKTHICPFCGKRWLRRIHLERHIRSHTGEKPFKCDQCNKSFTEHSGLIKHTRIHTGEKPYKCETCSMAFKVSSHLITHARIHTGEKPFKCKTCGKTCNRQDDLVKHLRVHTDDKPYVCKVCGKTFKRQDYLNRHTKMMHPVKKTAEMLPDQGS